MPLQWLPLQQRQKIQPRSVVSEALTPRPRPVQGPVGGGFAEAGGTMPNRFVEEQKARWAEEDKLKKLERDRSVEEAQEMGMRIRAAYEKEKLGGRQVSAQAAAGAPEAAPLTKENMPQAAKAMWDFILTLDEAGQKFFIQQLKKKEQPTGGFIEAGGVRKEMPGSVGMYGYLVDQGLLDPATDTVIEREPEEMKGRFSIEEGYIYDTTTGEKKKLSIEEPEKAIAEINREANSYALQLSKAGEISFEDAKYDYFIDNNVDPDIAKEMSKFTEMPKDPSKSNWFKNALKWIGGTITGALSPETTKAKLLKGTVAFNEANVTSLVPVISDDVTTAERAHLKGQGASDADINEAIRRKAGE